MSTSANGNGSLSATRQTEISKLDRVVIRFAGDSGDGMQLTGDRFTSEAAAFGNDLSTMPNFPAEIRAPQGTIPGVSSFQVHFADYDILTPRTRPAVPCTRVHLSTLTLGVLEETGLSKKDAERAKTMFALGLLSWMYHRPTEGTERYLREKFAKKADIAEANILAFRAGWNYGETTESFATTFQVAPAKLGQGTYRQITGNTALAYGLIAAGQQAQLPILLGTYPITPASDVLHELSKHKDFGILTFQAEDEIAGIGAALGASYGGALGVTSTSGPGIALKSETIGLGVMTELPLVVVDVHRGGPPTGLPP